MECCYDLFTSCETGCIECTNRFLQLGYDMSLKDEYGWAPFHLVSRNNRIECITLLLRNGAIIDEKADHSQSTALHFACSEGHYDSIKLLLNHNALINEKDIEGSTPLHLSIANNHTQCADILLKYGASINNKDHDGNTPLHYACINQHYDCIKLLLQYNVDINVQNDTGVTPLHFAGGCFGKLSCVQLLLEAGADYELKDNNGETPIDYTVNGDICSLIRSYEDVQVIKGALD